MEHFHSPGLTVSLPVELNGQEMTIRIQECPVCGAVTALDYYPRVGYSFLPEDLFRNLADCRLNLNDLKFQITDLVMDYERLRLELDMI